MNAENVIEVVNLTKRFGKFTAVDAVSFNVRRGEIFGFLGPNGAGKSTTIRMLCGLLGSTAGTATVGGFDNHSKLTQMRLWTVHEKPKRNSDKHLYPSGKMAHFFGRVAASSSDCVLSAATNLRESDCARTAFVRAAPAMRGRRVEVGSLSRYCGIVFSPVEARLAALSSNELALVDAHFRVLSSMPPAKEAAFSADGTRLLAQACHGVRVWDVHSGAALSSLCTGSGKEDLTCMAASLHSVVAVGRTTKNVGIELYDIL